jgi:hypothetical protein
MGTNLAPGEGRSVTLTVSGFESSPYSVLAMAGESPLRDLFERESGFAERARLMLLASPANVSQALLTLAADPTAFRERYLRETLQQPGLATEAELAAYLVSLPTGLAIPTADNAPEGPADLLAEALAANCAVPSTVPDCVADVAPVQCALPGCRVVFDTPVPVALPFEGGAVVAVPSSVTRGYTEFDCADTKVVAPCDPNVIVGPVGFGGDRWVSASKPMDYEVDFENLAGVAQAPAQVVKVTVPLDPGLDFASFRLGNAGFGGVGGKTIVVPPGKTAFDNGGIFYSDLGLYVQFTAGINPTTGQATFTFSTLGPDRQPPANTSVGFLPVNDGTGRGQGYVKFSIQPKSLIASGAAVPESASIRFDQNAPVNTNRIANRVDSRDPLSSVTPALEILDPTHLRIHWLGQDDASGSGLRGYSVFMQQDTGPFTDVGSLLTSNAMELTVDRGHNYSFYSQATDNTDNQEPAKSAPDQVVQIGTVVLGSGPPQLPKVTLLHQNAPNPWRGTTLIRFELATDSEVTLEVFDIQGRVVAKLLDHKQLQAGAHSVPIDRLPGGPGVYFYRMQAKSFESTKRMVRLQ